MLRRRRVADDAAPAFSTIVRTVHAALIGGPHLSRFRAGAEQLRAAQIRTEAGRVPRLHDFRHTFAVQALQRWYRAGADVNAKLPLLPTYMGHVSTMSEVRRTQSSSTAVFGGASAPHVCQFRRWTDCVGVSGQGGGLRWRTQGLVDLSAPSSQGSRCPAVTGTPIDCDVSLAFVLERRASPRRSPPPSLRPAERRPRG